MGTPAARICSSSCSIVVYGVVRGLVLANRSGRDRHDSNSPVRSMCGPGKSTDADSFVPSSWPYRHSVSVITAALVAAYCGVGGSGAMPPLPLEVLTTWPSSSCASITGTNALMPWMTPQTLTASAHSQSRASCSHIGPSAEGPMPALLQTTCTAPNAANVASRSAATDSQVETSVGTPMTSSPSA